MPNDIPKAIQLPNGSYMRFGQIIQPAGVSTMSDKPKSPVEESERDRQARVETIAAAERKAKIQRGVEQTARDHGVE